MPCNDKVTVTKTNNVNQLKKEFLYASRFTVWSSAITNIIRFYTKIEIPKTNGDADKNLSNDTSMNSVNTDDPIQPPATRSSSQPEPFFKNVPFDDETYGSVGEDQSKTDEPTSSNTMKSTSRKLETDEESLEIVNHSRAKKRKRKKVESSNSTSLNTMSQKRLEAGPADTLTLFDDLDWDSEKPGEYNEELNRYFRNTDIGETVKSKSERYFVVRKAGFGHSATAWLVYGQTKKRFSVIKMFKSNHRSSRELSNLKHILRNKCHPDYQHVTKLRDFFTLSNTFDCLVFEPLGMSLLALVKRSSSGLELPAVRKILLHCLRGLQFIHEHVKRIHADIKPENILVTVTDRSFYLETQKVIEQGFNDPTMRGSHKGSMPPELEEDELEYFNFIKSNCPPPINETLPMFATPEPLPNMNGIRRFRDLDQRVQTTREVLRPGAIFKIADLGNCLSNFNYNDHLATYDYRPPENIFKLDLHYSFDIWSLAVTAIECLTSHQIFRCGEGIPDNVDDHDNGILLQSMVNILGDFDEDLFKDSPIYEKLKMNLESSVCKQETQFEAIWCMFVDYGFKREESYSIAKLIDQMLQFDQHKRCLPVKALEHKFFEET